MTRPEHWDAIYRNKSEEEVSWFEAVPAVSIEFLEAAGLTADTCVVDIGGGRSQLVDALLGRGLHCLAVLDISGEAMRHAKARLGSQADIVTWIEADVTSGWSIKPMDIWHDRAMFHFLMAHNDRAAYVTHLKETLKPGGNAIISTFAPDGPPTCSGLPVARYSADTLASELGDGLELIETRPWHHVTPSGARQSFQYSRFRRVP